VKVKELIAKLRTFDGDAMVAIASYDSGFTELCDIEQVDLAINTVVMPDGSTHHLSSWVEAGKKKNIVAICVGPLDPSKLAAEAEG
jgi:hypothetical protein